LRVLQKPRDTGFGEKRDSQYLEIRVKIPRDLYIELLEESLKRYGDINDHIIRAIKLWIDIARGRAKIVSLKRV